MNRFVWTSLFGIFLIFSLVQHVLALPVELVVGAGLDVAQAGALQIWQGCPHQAAKKWGISGILYEVS